MSHEALFISISLEPLRVLGCCAMSRLMEVISVRSHFSVSGCKGLSDAACLITMLWILVAGCDKAEMSR